MKKNMNENFEITVDEMTEIFGDTPVEMSFREVKEGMDSFFGLMGLTVELVNLIRKEDELKKHHRAYLHVREEIAECANEATDVEALAEEYKDQVIIGKCDVDDNDELTGKFGVRNIPTVLFIKDGEVKDKTVGAVTKAQLEEKIKALL